METKKIKKDDFFVWLCRLGNQFNTAFLISDPNHPKNPIVFANDSFLHITGYVKNQIIGHNLQVLIGEKDDQHKIANLIENLKVDNYPKSEILIYKYDGTPIWCDVLVQPLFIEDQHIYNIVIFSEIKLKNNELVIMEREKIQQLAYIDSISGLTNYNYFIDKFNDIVSTETTGFVLFIQPSEYLNIVDTFGKTQLAMLHRELEKRIKFIFSEIEIIISRANEASLIIAGFCKEDEIEHCAQMLLQTTIEPIFLNDIELYISVNVGSVSLSYYTGNDTEDIVRLADIALNYSKKNAGNSIVFYKDEYGYELNQQMKLRNELIHALKNNEIYINLQPKVHIETGCVESFEALARWYSKKLGQVPPMIFIEAAEALGKIQELDFLVIEKVLSWLKNRKEKNLRLYQVSVNISPGHFYTPDFIENLLNMTKKYGIEPKYIKIELTENIGLVDMEKAKQILDVLKQVGFESSVDDFGIGFSSLSYLHKLPVSELKIDRSFINNIHEEGGNAIVKTIIQLAKSMGMTSVAEGIETEEQLAIIRDLSCQIAQGYYFYKPLSLDEVDEILLKENV